MLSFWFKFSKNFINEDRESMEKDPIYFMKTVIGENSMEINQYFDVVIKGHFDLLVPEQIMLHLM